MAVETNGNVVTITDERAVGEEKSKIFTSTNWKNPLVLFIGELLGTAVLVFCGCLCTIQIESLVGEGLAGPIGFGFTVCVVINIFGCISGAHVNPAVTLCAALYGLIPYWMILVYVPAQIAGSLLGFGMLAASMPFQIYSDKTSGDGICLTLPHEQMTVGNAFICEFFLTMLLILVCCGLWDQRNEKYQDSISIKFGITIAALSIAGGNLTGASMNPARSLGPAVWNNQMQHQWLYWVSPLSSSLITTLAYRFIFRKEAPKQSD